MSTECQGKGSWPELLGVQADIAVTTIEKENPRVTAIIVPEGSSVILNFDCNRVWVWVNKDNVVIKVPMIG